MIYYEQDTRRILDFIRQNDNFLVSAHVSADGDAYGAALGVAALLEGLGKRYQVVVPDAVKDSKYRTLRGWEAIVPYSEDLSAVWDAAIVVDLSGPKRLGDVQRLLPLPAQCVMIDHHPLEEAFADIILHDTSASSASRLVFELIRASPVALDAEIATILLSGIMYDTGRFSFSNTSARDFEVAAELLAAGARPEKISDFMVFNNSLLSLQTIGYGLDTMQLHLDGKVGEIYLPREKVEVAAELDLDPLASYSLSVTGSEVGIFIRETSGFFKVSLRSRGRVNVNLIARKYGGGGHIQAAGCRWDGNLPELRDGLLREIAAQLAEQA